MIHSKNKIIFFLINFLIVHFILLLFFIYRFLFISFITYSPSIGIDKNAYWIIPTTLVFHLSYLIFIVKSAYKKKYYNAFIVFLMFLYLIFVPIIIFRVERNDVIHFYKEIFIYNDIHNKPIF
jgi:hypothetical protein